MSAPILTPNKLTFTDTSRGLAACLTRTLSGLLSHGRVRSMKGRGHGMIAENEFLLWGTLAMICGGALFAWVMKFPIWKGASVISGGIALSAAGGTLFGVVSQVAGIALFVVGASIAGSVIGFNARETAWSVIGGIAGGFVAGMLIATFGSVA